MKPFRVHSAAVFFLAVAAKSTFAAHPFVTDDTGTQGRGGHQLEFNTDWVRRQNGGGGARIASSTYTWGWQEDLDLFASIAAGIAAPAGIGNITLGAKWRFLESDSSSVALRPEFLLPSPSEDKGLGSGSGGMALTLIATQEAGQWIFHGNAGVDLNRYRHDAAIADNRNALWRLSAAAAYRVTPGIALVGDIGVARNSDATSRVNPAFILAGVVYSPRKDLDLDAGVKFGLNRAEVDRQIGIGLTSRF
jgi:hypothetical protein